MKRVYSAPTITEVHLLRALLEGEGIESMIKNEHVAGLAGEIPFFEAWPEIWVLNDQDAKKAEWLIAQFQEDTSPNESKTSEE